MFCPTKTSKINENIYVVRTFMVDFFVYTDGDSYIAIDTGLSSVMSRMGLKKLNINPADISHVFLTHTDYDHVGGINLFKNADIYISKKEEQMIDGTTARMLIKHNNLKKDYKLLDDEKTVQIGNIKVTAVSTPGHTPGSMSYIINDHILFAGDTMSLRGKKVYPFYWLQNMDTGRQKKSIRAFLSRDYKIDSVYTAHTGYTDNFSEAVKRWDE